MLAPVLPPTVQRPNLFLASKYAATLDKKRNKFTLFNFLYTSHLRIKNFVVLIASVMLSGVIFVTVVILQSSV